MLKDIKIGVKLLGGFLIVALITLIIGFVGLFGLRSLASAADNIGKNRIPDLVSLQNMSEQRVQIRAYLNLVWNYQNIPQSMSDYKSLYDSKLKAMDAFQKDYDLYQSRKRATEAGRKLSEQLKLDFEAWRDGQVHIDKLIQEMSLRDYSQVEKNQLYARYTKESEDLVPLRNAINKTLDAAIENNTQNTDRIIAENSKTAAMLVSVSILAMVAGVVFSILIGILLSRAITRPVSKGVAFAQTLAKGDLTGRIDLDQKDELGQLAKALNDMADQLSEVVQNVQSGAEQVAASSEELAKGNQDLSSRTEQQAAALEETSSTMEEMNSSIKSNAEGARSASQLASDANEKAVRGGAAVQNVVESMDGINNSSKKIADIISVMNEIAFQTNILALNASIEAAKAGEMGRGFAVVAVEVRKLAQRSDEAAKEISVLIKESNEKIVKGVDVANEAGSALKEINEAVKKVNNLIGEISASSQEQLVSVDEINKSLANLDENTQRNASLVEEAASATEELSGQAQELNSAINYFTISDTTKHENRTGVTEANPHAKLLSHH